MTATLRSYLELVRVANLFTAMADVTAAFVYGGGSLDDWPTWATLAAASCCLYAGGVALNDVFDAEIDAGDRPDRPIPSGRVSKGRALSLSVVLLLIGSALAVYQSLGAGLVASAIVVSIVLYNGPLKRTPLAPVMMGVCRALNFALPLVALDLSLTRVEALAPMTLILVYIASVTLIAGEENTVRSRTKLRAGVVGAVLAVAGTFGLYWVVTAHHASAFVAGALLTTVVAACGFRVLIKPCATQAKATVARLLVGLIGLDGCIAWSVAGPIPAMVVLVLAIPTVAFGFGRKGFQVT